MDGGISEEISVFNYGLEPRDVIGSVIMQQRERADRRAPGPHCRYRRSRWMPLAACSRLAGI